MAEYKKNTMINFIVPMVDKTDFATLESTLSAVDINIRLFGVAQGVSTLASTITVSKAAQLVRSGIFQITLKAGEVDSHDAYLLRLSSTSTVSCAIQLIPFTVVDNDDSDLMSMLTYLSGAISDVDSALTSQFNWTSNMLSDASSVRSNAYSMLSDFFSDFQSRVPKRVATDSQLSDLTSDLRSFLVSMSDTLSDFYSDFQSRVPKRVATDSQLSDLHSDIRSFLVSMSDVLSNTYSGVQLLESAFVGHTGSTASTVTDASVLEIDGIDHDDQFNGYYIKLLGGSQVDELRLIVDTQKTPSTITVKPAFNSRVLSGVDFVIVAGNPYQSKVHSDIISSITSAASDVKSAIVVAQSQISDVHSLVSDTTSDLRSFLVGMSGVLSDTYSLLSDLQSDFQSRVPKRVATDSQLSDVHSDLQSRIAGITASVSASDISDIASAVWAAQVTTNSNAGSFGSHIREVIGSRVSDIQSMLSDFFSDFQSRVPKRVATDSQLSDVHSDLRSQITGITASVSASDISDIASAVWAAKYTAHSNASSFGSLISDISSRILLNQSRISDTYSMVSDLYSDFQSRVPKAVATNSQVSDLASDLRSVLVVMSGVLSDTYSAVSDLQSDFQSRVPKRVATDSQLSDVHSDLRSQIGGITASVSASDISDIASAVKATLASDVSDILSAAQQTNSRVLLNQSRVSDIYSMLSDVQSDFQSRVPKRVATDSQLSDVHSDLQSRIGGITAAVSASDISDIASAVRAQLVSDLSDILSAAVQTNSRALVNQSRVSDIYSLLSDANSDLRSLITAGVPLDASTMSDLRSSIAAGGTAGAGAIAITFTQKDTGGSPIDGVRLWITTDSAGTNVVSGSIVTNTLGVATGFNVTGAGTYYRRASLGGRNFTNPQSFVVAATPSAQSFEFTDGSLATGSGGVTGVDKREGYDYQVGGPASTPFTIPRGSRVVIRRTMLAYNPNTGATSLVNISGGQATAIVWHLLPDLKQGTVNVLAKTLAASDITLPNGGADGILEFVIDDSDTVNVDEGTYWAEIAIVVGGNRLKFNAYQVTIGAAGNLGE